MFQKYHQMYSQNDFAVIPLKGKRPELKNWSIFSDRLPTENELIAWSKVYPNSNIGLVLGKASGLVAVDIDTEDEKILEKINRVLPETPLIKKGKKGETRFYKFNNEIPFKIHPIIELLSTGNQTVLPPSIHPETNEPYVWIDSSLEYSNPDKLPTLPANFKDLIQKALEDIKDKPKQSGGRNNTLKAIAIAMMDRGESIDTIINELLTHDKLNHKTPLFSDRSEGMKSDEYSNALRFVSSIRSSVSDIIKPYTVNVSDLIAEDSPEIVKEEEFAELELPPPQGTIKDLYEYILSQSYIERPKLAYASAISTMSVLLCNKVKIMDLSPVIYNMFIAPSTEGKDVPLKMATDNLLMADAENYIGKSSMESDSGILIDLPVQREVLYSIDEADGLFRSLSNPSAATHHSKLASLLSELYSKSNSRYFGKKIVKEPIPRGRCWYPCVNIVAAMTTHSFETSFNVDILERGLGARFIYYVEEKSKKSKFKVDRKPLHPKTLEELKFWAKHTPKKEVVKLEDELIQALQESDNDVPYEEYKPIPINWHISQEAYVELEKAHTYFDEEKQKVPMGDKTRSLYGRAYEQMIRHLIVFTASRRPLKAQLTVEPEDVKWAFEYMRAMTHNNAKMFQKSFASSQIERDNNKVLEKIERAKSKGVTLSELTRSVFQNMSLNQKNSSLNTLIESDKIVALKSKKDSRKSSTIYVSTKYVKKD